MGLENRPCPRRRSVSDLWKIPHPLWRFGYRQRQEINYILRQYAEHISQVRPCWLKFVLIGHICPVITFYQPHKTIYVESSRPEGFGKPRPQH